jgi:ABC-type multidrug transport system fused ATPase/permease subunit
MKEATGMPPSARSAFAEYYSFWRMLAPFQRRQAMLLLAGTMAGAALEVLGLAALAALMTALTTGSVPTGSAILALRAWPSATPDETIVRLLAACGLIFFVKNSLMAGTAWLEATFTFRLYAWLSNRTLISTLEGEYEQVTRKPAAEQINLLTADLATVVFNAVLPALSMLSEAVLMVAILAFLLWTETQLTLLILVTVGGIAGLLMRFSRKAVLSQGARRQKIEVERLRRLSDIYDHLREVYVYRAGAQVTRQVRTVTVDLADVYRSFQMLSTSPRFLLEVALIGVLLAAIAIGLGKPERSSLLVSVSLFAASGFRLLLGANRLIMSAQSIRFGQASLHRLIAALRASNVPSRGETREATTTWARSTSFEVRDVQFSYPTSATPVLRGVDLELRRGVMIGIRGSSGGGKTSLLEVLAGLRRPVAGGLFLDGRPLRNPREDLFRVVGYVGQSPAIFRDTVRRNVAYGFDDAEIDDAKVWSALESAQLAEFIRALPERLDALLDGTRLSGGQAQRIALARALYPECAFLLLDEPTSALDPATEAQVVATLRSLAREHGVLLVSHRLRPLEACDTVYELRDGHLLPPAYPASPALAGEPEQGPPARG